MTTLQQIMFLFSIRMLNYTPENCFGKESFKIVLHKEYAGMIMFHKTLTLKYSKHAPSTLSHPLIFVFLY